LDVTKLLWKVLRDQDDHGVAVRVGSCTTRGAREREDRKKRSIGRRRGRKRKRRRSGSGRKRKRRKGESGVVDR
jgi:hypothetical protein